MSSQKVKNDSEFSPLQLHSRSDVAFYQFRDVTVGMKRTVSEDADDFRPWNKYDYALPINSLHKLDVAIVHHVNFSQQIDSAILYFASEV